MTDFEQFVTAISNRNPLQKRFLAAHLSKTDAVFRQRAEAFFQALSGFPGATQDELVTAYIDLCKEMLAEQIRFKKTGTYSASSADAVKTALYDDDTMRARVFALGLSQFLWPNHYKMLDFFLSALEHITPETYLEIGPGHGIHLLYALNRHQGMTATVVDISEHSLTICREMLAHFCPEHLDRVTFIKGDATDEAVLPLRSFDQVVMNEVLEHVDEPLALIRAIARLVPVRGNVFVTTCANAPAVDHVYLYNNVDEIRQQIVQGGLHIVDELCLPVGSAPEGRWEVDRVEINYAAMLRVALTVQGT